MPDHDSCTTSAAHAKPKVSRKVARRLGIGLFLFFLIKGLAWLVVPLVIGLYVFLKG